MSQRTKCPSCKTRIGYHWLFFGVFDLLILVPLGIVAFLVALDVGLLAGGALLVIGGTVLNLLAARFGPREAKTRRLQP